MNNTKRGRLTKLTALLMVFALITSVVTSGTIAKYTTTATANDTARVAIFDVDIDDSTTFDLFGTLLEDDVATAETDAWSNGTDKVVAPGTGGEFDVVFENNSEVTVSGTLTLNVVNAGGIPIEFSSDGGTTWVAASAFTLTDADIADGETATIQWRWDFQTETVPASIITEDAVDTALGVAGTATVQVTVNAVFTQVD